MPLVASMVPRDHPLDKTLRIALAFHGGHACPGMVLGARLAVTAGRALELTLPDRRKRLFVTSETDRCGADAIQTITGCRPGKRTMEFSDYGKLAARFLDTETGRAIRVATRSGLRDIAWKRFPDADRHASQMRAYLELPVEELFSITPTEWSLGLYEQPGPPIRRVECADCSEEVSDGREVPAARGSLCQPCADSSQVPGGTAAQRGT
ncbi:MAG: formylmethanofuran dehydrogenase [Anaerolinea sp.]|nr:formylmethanofuran dehydrogenase [Anaerolinea sp.]